MNEQFVIEFIRQRMLQLGVEYYYFESVTLAPQKFDITMLLENERWYLVDLPDNLLIVSDSAFYQRVGVVLNSSNALEFTGNIRISFLPQFITGGGEPSGDIMVKFIRVIIQEA